MSLTADQMIDLRKNEYNRLLDSYKDMTKIFAVLFTFLGGVVSAFASLFTVYCLCRDKEISKIEWILFVINVVAICGTASANLYGIFLDRMIKNKKRNATSTVKRDIKMSSSQEGNNTFNEQENKVVSEQEYESNNKQIKEEKSKAEIKEFKDKSVDEEKDENSKYLMIRKKIITRIKQDPDDILDLFFLGYHNSELKLKIDPILNYNSNDGVKNILGLCNEMINDYKKEAHDCAMEIKKLVKKNGDSIDNIKEIIKENTKRINECEKNIKQYNEIITKIIEKENNKELLSIYDSLIAEIEKKIIVRRRILKLVCCCNVVLIILMAVSAIILKAI